MASAYWIVGPGRVGLSLGSVLVRAGFASEVLLVGRRPEPPEHPLLTAPTCGYRDDLPGAPPSGVRLLLAVPDGAIRGVAERIARLGEPGSGCAALHLSGVQSAAVLAPLARCGYATGSLHPLQTIADPLTGPERLREAFFTFEGDTRARTAAWEIVEAAEGRMLEVRARDKAHYHAACVFASNYVVTCAGVATRLLSAAAGIDREEAARALQPLWRGALANLEALGPARGLTGPVARGDVETVRTHLAALEGGLRDLYARLALQALELAREAGLDPAVARELELELRNSSGGGAEER